MIYGKGYSADWLSLIWFVLRVHPVGKRSLLTGFTRDGFSVNSLKERNQWKRSSFEGPRFII